MFSCSRYNIRLQSFYPSPENIRVCGPGWDYTAPGTSVSLWAFQSMPTDGTVNATNKWTVVCL